MEGSVSLHFLQAFLQKVQNDLPVTALLTGQFPKQIAERTCFFRKTTIMLRALSLFYVPLPQSLIGTGDTRALGSIGAWLFPCKQIIDGREFLGMLPLLRPKHHKLLAVPSADTTGQSLIGGGIFHLTAKQFHDLLRR